MKASICVTTYNSEKLIRRTLDSVLAQTFDDFEVVIVDDYSTDNTVNIITNEYCARDKRFKLFVNTTNYKWPYIDSFNKSYEYASGELLFRLDHDDVLLPDYLDHAVKYMDEHPDVSGCCYRLILYDTKQIVDVNHIDETRLEHVLVSNYNKWGPLFNNCPPAITHLAGYCDSVYMFHNPGSCLRKSFYDKTHPQCFFYSCGDQLFWLDVMGKGGKVVILEDYQIIYTGTHTCSGWAFDENRVEKIWSYKKDTYLQYYYNAYLTYVALTQYDDNLIIKDNTTALDLKRVLYNTALCFKDLLEKENLYDKIEERYRI